MVYQLVLCLTPGSCREYSGPVCCSISPSTRACATVSDLGGSSGAIRNAMVKANAKAGPSNHFPDRAGAAPKLKIQYQVAVRSYPLPHASHNCGTPGPFFLLTFWLCLPRRWSKSFASQIVVRKLGSLVERKAEIVSKASIWNHRDQGTRWVLPIFYSFSPGFAAALTPTFTAVMAKLAQRLGHLLRL
jgi:hypothetical protein